MHKTEHDLKINESNCKCNKNLLESNYCVEDLPLLNYCNILGNFHFRSPHFNAKYYVSCSEESKQEFKKDRWSERIIRET